LAGSAEVRSSPAARSNDQVRADLPEAVVDPLMTAGVRQLGHAQGAISKPWPLRRPDGRG
jgi:hypothetical protein